MTERSLSENELLLLEKIRDLSPGDATLVADLVDFLCQRQLTREAMVLSESSLEKVWDNPDNAEYDNL